MVISKAMLWFDEAKCTYLMRLGENVLLVIVLPGELLCIRQMKWYLPDNVLRMQYCPDPPLPNALVLCVFSFLSCTQRALILASSQVSSNREPSGNPVTIVLKGVCAPLEQVCRRISLPRPVCLELVCQK